MAVHKSADKRNRQNIKRNARNRDARAATRTAIKKALMLADSGDIAGAKEAAKVATSLLGKEAIHHLAHKKNVQRRVSRLYRHINSAEASA